MGKTKKLKGGIGPYEINGFDRISLASFKDKTLITIRDIIDSLHTIVYSIDVKEKLTNNLFDEKLKEFKKRIPYKSIDINFLIILIKSNNLSDFIYEIIKSKKTNIIIDFNDFIKKHIEDLKQYSPLDKLFYRAYQEAISKASSSEEFIKEHKLDEVEHLQSTIKIVKLIPALNKTIASQSDIIHTPLFLNTLQGEIDLLKANIAMKDFIIEEKNYSLVHAYASLAESKNILEQSKPSSIKPEGLQGEQLTILNKSKDEEIQSLTAELDKQIDEFAAKIRKKNTELLEAQQEHAAKLEEKNIDHAAKLEEQNRVHAYELKRLQDDLAKNNREHAAELEKKNREHKSELEKKDLTHTASLIAAHTSYKSDLQSKLQTSEQKILDKAKRELQEEFALMERKLKDELDIQKREIEQKLLDKTTEVNNLNAESLKLKGELEQLNLELVRIKGTHESEKLLHTLQLESLTESKNILEQQLKGEIKRLEETLTEKKAQISILQPEIREKEGEIKRLQQTLAERETELGTSEKNKGELALLQAKLHEETEKATRELEILRAEKDKIIEEAAKRSADELRRLQSESDARKRELRETIEKNSQQLQTLQRQMDEARAELLKKQKDLGKATSETLETLRREAEEAKKTLSEKEAAQLQLEKDKQELKTRLQLQVDETARRLSEVELAARAAQNELNRTREKELGDLRKTVEAEQKGEIERLKAELDALQNATLEIGKLKQENLQIEQNEINDTQSKFYFFMYNMLLDSLQAKINLLEYENDEIREDQEIKLSRLEDDRAALISELDRVNRGIREEIERTRQDTIEIITKQIKEESNAALASSTAQLEKTKVALAEEKALLAEKSALAKEKSPTITGNDVKKFIILQELNTLFSKKQIQHKDLIDSLNKIIIQVNMLKNDSNIVILKSNSNKQNISDAIGSINVALTK